MNEKALKEIRQFRAEINKCLDDSEADLLNKLQKVTQKNTETQTKIEKRLEKLSSELEKVKQMLNAQLHSENSLFINAVTCKSKLFDIEKMYENKEQDCVLLTFDFVRNEHMSGLLKSEGPIGSLKIDKKTKQKHFVIGVRVRRGPDWKYRDQDGGGPGTLVGFESNGWANVKWDNGYINNYRVGQENSFDLEII